MMNLRKCMRLVKTMCMMDEEYLILMSKSQLVLLFHISGAQLHYNLDRVNYMHTATIHPTRSCRALCENTVCCLAIIICVHSHTEVLTGHRKALCTGKQSYTMYTNTLHPSKVTYSCL